MKKRFTLFVFTTILLSLVSWKNAATTTNKLNANSWSIRIGEKELLTSAKHQMGDVVSVRKKTLKVTDFIHAEMFLCGQSADKSTTTLTVKNGFGKTIKAYKFNGSTIIFGGDIPVKDLLNLFAIGETISIYFTITSVEKGLNSTVLIGRLKLD